MNPSRQPNIIFSMTVYTKKTTDGGENILTIGKLDLVNLAGNDHLENANDDANEPKFLMPMMMMAVLTNLCWHSKMPSRCWENVISGIEWTWINLVVLKIFWFRESSTLTCLLRDSLGGGTKTSIITTIAPTSALKKSKPTLDIALKAMKVVNHPINPKRTKDDPYLFLPANRGQCTTPVIHCHVHVLKL